MLWPPEGAAGILGDMNVRAASRRRILLGLGGLLLLCSLGLMDAAHQHHHYALDPDHADAPGLTHVLCAVLHAGALVATADVQTAPDGRVVGTVASAPAPSGAAARYTSATPRAPPSVLS